MRNAYELNQQYGNGHGKYKAVYNGQKYTLLNQPFWTNSLFKVMVDVLGRNSALPFEDCEIIEE